DMIIQNLGNGPALNIKFSLNPEFEHKKGHKLSHLGFFKNGIPYLDSKQKIRFPLTIITENPQEKMKTKFDIAVSYEDISGRKNEKIIPIDFTQFEGLTQLGVPPEYKIAREIEKMQSDIHSIINGKEIRVIRYTKEDDEEEKQKEREELKQLNEKHDQIKG
ncbi:MAG: hypothetical protein NT094_05280, partial [Candidatus Staskawiczbacteria bacterium]|nr:hypothetical protein [Candidatus Staskawiczbacteria bacterium]